MASIKKIRDCKVIVKSMYVGFFVLKTSRKFSISLNVGGKQQKRTHQVQLIDMCTT